MPNRPPVIFIPGFPASELLDAANDVVFPPSLKTVASSTKKQKFLDAVTDLAQLRAGEPIRETFFGIEKQAQSLYDILRLYGYSTNNPTEFRAIGWDWRRAVDDVIVQAAVRTAIQQMSAGATKVLTIVHSTGGLVLRQLLAAEPALGAKIAHILALGVPWAGTLKSFAYLVNGQSTGVPGARITAYESRRIIRGAQAAYDLLPPPRDQADPAGVPPPFARQGNSDVSPMVATSWIPASWRTRMEPMAAQAMRLRRMPDFPVANIPVTNVAGFGAATDTRADLVTGSATFTATAEGDGTVPHASAVWLRGPNVRTFSLAVGVYPTGGIPLYHSQIWDAPPMLSLFDELLLVAPPEPFIAAALDANDASMGGQRPMKVHISGALPDGSPLIPMRVTFTNLKVPLSKTINGRGTITIQKGLLPIGTSSAFVRFNA
ncbi:MAG: lipase/acyltransferase domain-containing protein, partial [Thermoanaerobaculia bacterium]